MFKLNFYDIENQIADPGSIWLNLIFTMIGTGLGFFGAYLLSKRSERLQIRKDANQIINLHWSRLKYLTQLINSSLDVLLNNIDRFEKLTEVINEAPVEYHLLNLVADDNLQRLQKMDSKDIFDAYHILIPESEGSTNDFRNMYGSIDFLHFNMVQMLDSYIAYKENLKRDQNYIKDKIETLGTVVIKWIKDIEKEPNFGEQPKYIFLTKHYTIYKEMTAG